MPARLKKGDTVVILSGKDQGKQGKVLRVVDSGVAFVVEGLNIAKRHKRPSQTFQGGIVETPRPIPGSRVMLVCPRCHKPSRTRVQSGSEGARLRQCVKCSEPVDKE